MKTILAVIFVMVGVSSLRADTPSLWSDGNIKFAYGQVGSTYAWTSTEYDQMVSDCVGPCQIQVYIPEKWELNLRSCTVFNTDKYRAFDNYSDWVSLRTKRGLRRKVQAMRLEYDSMQDLSAGDKVDIIQRYNWLKSFYQSLP